MACLRWRVLDQANEVLSPFLNQSGMLEGRLSRSHPACAMLGGITMNRTRNVSEKLPM
jgi:hypothetical protein